MSLKGNGGELVDGQLWGALDSQQPQPLQGAGHGSQEGWQRGLLREPQRPSQGSCWCKSLHGAGRGGSEMPGSPLPGAGGEERV